MTSVKSRLIPKATGRSTYRIRNVLPNEDHRRREDRRRIPSATDACLLARAPRAFGASVPLFITQQNSVNPHKRSSTNQCPPVNALSIYPYYISFRRSPKICENWEQIQPQNGVDT